MKRLGNYLLKNLEGKINMTNLEQREKEFLQRFNSVTDGNFPDANIPLNDFWQWIVDNFIPRGRSLSEPIITTGKDMALGELQSLIEELPDVGTMPYEHTVILKQILTLIYKII